MAKVTYDDINTKPFDNIGVGDYFIYNGKLYLKLNYDYPINNALDFEKDKVVSFTKDANIIFKSGKDIEIYVNK